MDIYHQPIPDGSDMLHWERLCSNPLGRCLWAVRFIPTGVYGDPYTWSLVVLRSHWLSRKAKIMLATPMTVKGRRLLERSLRQRGFKQAEAIRNGSTKQWK